jgi:hypothetical protein
MPGGPPSLKLQMAAAISKGSDSNGSPPPIPPKVRSAERLIFGASDMEPSRIDFKVISF